MKRLSSKEIAEKEKISVVSTEKKTCNSHMLRYSHTKPGLDGVSSDQSSAFTIVNLDMFLSPTISTMILNKNKSGEDLFDMLMKIGGMFAFCFLVL